jgi:hypothetical protein
VQNLHKLKKIFKLITQAIYKLIKSIKEFHQCKGVPEQPTLVSIPLFCSWQKIKCQIYTTSFSFYGMADCGMAWRPKKIFFKLWSTEEQMPALVTYS